MIIVVETEYTNEIHYAATVGSETASSGYSWIYAFQNEKAFRKAFPEAPEFIDGYASWNKKQNHRPCNCGSGVPWFECQADSPRCG